MNTEVNHNNETRKRVKVLAWFVYFSFVVLFLMILYSFFIQ